MCSNDTLQWTEWTKDFLIFYHLVELFFRRTIMVCMLNSSTTYEGYEWLKISHHLCLLSLFLFKTNLPAANSFRWNVRQWKGRITDRYYMFQQRVLLCLLQCALIDVNCTHQSVWGTPLRSRPWIVDKTCCYHLYWR